MDHEEPDNRSEDKQQQNSVETGFFWGTLFNTIGLAILGVLEAIFS